MGERTEKLLLLDTASLYFRAYFGVPDSVKAPDGTPVNAVRGLLDMIARLVTDHRPTRLVMCWDDDWRPQFRVDAIPSYKAHRVAVEVPGTTGVEEVPDTLSPQVPIIVEVLEALGIARVGVPGYEADDVIGTLVAREVAKKDRAPVDVITGDRDLFQLVDDSVPGAGALHDPGHQGPDGHRPGGAPGEVRGLVGTRLRGHGRAARGPERRAAGRAGDRREDGRAAGAPVRVAGRDPRRARRGGRRADGDAAEAPRGGRGLPGGRACRGPRGAGRARGGARRQAAERRRGRRGARRAGRDVGLSSSVKRVVDALSG